ncbi:alpha/beta hydrolase [Microtetraspora sp. NBRC 16547]|uniref:alpha/beta fold hydrolase n=1 Tax=Microtetraspora sp. NBRC 16547 TaxID=3030993 RepID=UPI00255730CC|nr:alpha/beta hydrolase [Microtetraspora sp. NBRC 16547]
MVNISGVFRVAGCDLRYWDHPGEGIPVVFSHGAGADHVMFQAQADHLAGLGHRVITWDMRGHGASRPTGAPFTAARAIADLLALLEHLRLDRVVLAGQSLGGNLSQAVVRLHPEIALGLIVIGSAWNAAPLSRLERLLLRTAAPGLSMIPAGRLPAVLARASAITEGAREDARRAFSQLTKREFLDVWRATTDLLDPNPAYRTPVPLCLIRGELDRTGNIASGMPQWARVEGIDEIVIPGAGHIANQDAPDTVNAAIESFLLGAAAREVRNGE